MYLLINACKLILKPNKDVFSSIAIDPSLSNAVYNSRDHECIPNATDNSWANCPGQNPEHEYHFIHTLGWSLQLTNITLYFDVNSENIYYGKNRIKCDLERGCCPLNHAIKATVISETNKHCRIFDVGRSYARMVKFQERFFYLNTRK